MNIQEIIIKRRLSSLIVLILILTGTFIHGQPDKRFQITFFGGINHHFSYGSVDDYAFNENDFPVMPGHAPINFGIAAGIFLGGHFGLELEDRYTLSSSVSLNDPSDGDTVRINSFKHNSFSLNVIYFFSQKRIAPYVILGIGTNEEYEEKDKVYTSAYGYEITLQESPSKGSDFQMNAGAGVNLEITSNLGVRLDIRYVRIIDSPDKINTLNPTIGAYFRF